MRYFNKIRSILAADDDMPTVNVDVDAEESIIDDDNSIVALLQIALVGEYQQWDLYTSYASRLKGPSRSPIADEFGDHADEEEAHIELIQRYIVSLGQSPTLQRKKLPEMPEDASIKDIVKLQLKFENDAVNLYKKILTVLKDNDPLKIDIENILTKEQEHVHDLELLINDGSIDNAAEKAVQSLLEDYYSNRKSQTIGSASRLNMREWPNQAEYKKLSNDSYAKLRKMNPDDKVDVVVSKGAHDVDVITTTVKDALHKKGILLSVLNKVPGLVKASMMFRPQEPGEPTKPQAGYGQGCGCGCGCPYCVCLSPKSFLTRVDNTWCTKAMKELTPDIYARWHQSKLLSPLEKSIVSQAISLKWSFKDRRAMNRLLETIG